MEVKEYIAKEKINDKIKELAEKISSDYKDKNIELICVLKGASVFAVELALNIKGNVRFQFIEVSSYEGFETTGEIKLNKDITSSIKGKDVLIVEDIIDTGITLSYLKEYLLKKEPNSLKICTLISKREKRRNDVFVDYIGFEIADKFIVGFGLDYNEDYRNLPYIGVIEQEKNKTLTKKC